VRVLLSVSGVEEIEILYLPGQRTKSWTFCQRLLPAIQELDAYVRVVANSDAPVPEHEPTEP